MSVLKGKGDFGGSPHRYELIDKDGKVVGWSQSISLIRIMAERYFPDQEQDEERSGRGWDVQVEGCDR